MPSTLDIVVQAATRLLSPAAPQVLGLVGSGAADIERLRSAIELDPVLTVRTIDYANHSFYARKVPVASLQRALVRLGWEASCELLSRLLVEMAAEKTAGALATPMWQHSLEVGVLTRTLARDVRIVDPALAFTAGLVHGIGQLGLLALHRDAYADVWRRARSGAHLARDERKQYGFDHAKVGAGVLETLSVPAELPGAVARMYRARLAERDWSGRPELPLAALLQLAQLLLYNDGERLDRPDWILSAPLAARLHLTETQAETLGARFRAAVADQLGASDDAEDAA